VICGSHRPSDSQRARPAGGVLVPIVLFLLSVATLRAQTKYSGGGGTPDDPYLIGTSSDLLALSADPSDWTGHFRLTADIDMADVPRDTVCMIGTAAVPFKGSFDGAGRRISHFTCICPDRNRVGLFGHIRALGGGVHDLCLIDPNVVAATGVSVGALVGHLGTGTVTGCRVEGGHVSGAMAVGGLVGWTYATITGCTAQAEVQGQYSVGGLVGLCAWDSQVRDCAADAYVTGISRVGGLAGACTGTFLQWSLAAGYAAGSSNVGGLVGSSEGASIMNCYSMTSINGGSVVGGLVGSNGSGSDDTGIFPGVICNSYSAGPVTGGTEAGGLVGLNEPDGLVEGSFWDIQTSGMKTSAGGTGLSTKQLQMQSTFVHAGWSFSQLAAAAESWTIRREPRYPVFTWQVLAGDFDGDGNIDLIDFSALAASWRRQSTSFEAGGADLTGDSRIDARDLQILCRQWLLGAREDR
jgi:hypothetical protein